MEGKDGKEISCHEWGKEYLQRLNAWETIGISSYNLFCPNFLAYYNIDPEDLPYLSDKDILSIRQIGRKTLVALRALDKGAQKQWKKAFYLAEKDAQLRYEQNQKIILQHEQEDFDKVFTEDDFDYEDD